MCGFIGYLKPKVNSPSLDQLNIASRLIQYRGPDDEGVLEVEFERNSGQLWRLGVAHRRLAIIDLAGSTQPLSSHDGRYVIVFNGEIYNYQSVRDRLMGLGHTFTTKGDTEVIIESYRRWGEDCVEYFNGMFAFSLWDKQNNVLMLARDRYGEKPLFVMSDAYSGLAFSSEIKALMALLNKRIEIDSFSIQQHLLYKYLPGPNSYFKEIKKVPPGGVLLWKDGNVFKHSYWRSPDLSVRECDKAISEEKTTNIIHQAVASRMVSDVPVGCFLSGGLDSSTVLYFMTKEREGDPVESFSVGFKRMGPHDPLDETQMAEIAAKHCGARFHRVEVDPGIVWDILPELTRFRDGPLSEPADVPLYIMSKFARQKVKVVLSGEGADEVFGGYPKYGVETFLSFVPGIAKPIFRCLAAHLTDGSKKRLLFEILGTNNQRERWARWFGAWSENDLQMMLNPPKEIELKELDLTPNNSCLRSIMAFDQSFWLTDNLLERADRMAMACSLETRMPFLDHRLLEYVTTIPDHKRAFGFGLKRHFRSVMSNYLPKQIINQPKIGFRTPFGNWMKTVWAGRIKELIGNNNSLIYNYLDYQKSVHLVDDYLTGKSNNVKGIWTLVALEFFLQEYL